MNKSLLAAVLLGGLMTGCAMVTPGYECELKPNESGKCASMQDAYRAAKRVQGSNAKRESVFDNQQEAERAMQTAANQPYFRGKDSGFPDQNEVGMPVFKQPQVHRVWVAPYVDADGNLRSGEYTYFATPGEWNYGSTTRSGQAAGMFGPAQPGNYGFNPVDTKKTQTVPNQAPPQPDVPAATPTGASVKTPGSTTTTSVDGITQPGQRF